MFKKDLSLVCSTTKRSYEYIKEIKNNKIKTNIVIVYENKKNKNKHLLNEILFFLKKFNFKFIFIKNSHINKKSFSKIIFKYTKKNILLSLYPGEIIKNSSFFQKRNCFHNHTGLLPSYRGSTTIYYSILKEKKIYCTTFKINKNIDDGIILYTNKYNFPKKKMNIDEYDNIIRAKHFVKFLKGETGINKKNLHEEIYYTIHPVLRNIAHKVFNDNLDIG